MNDITVLINLSTMERRTVFFSEIAFYRTFVKASLSIDPNTTWKPNDKDKIKLVTSSTVSYVTPEISDIDVETNRFTIRIDGNFTQQVGDCKLVYIDKDGTERGESSDIASESSGSLHSSGSFEAVSDDDYSFTVIDTPLVSDMSISRDWEITSESSKDAETVSPSAGNQNKNFLIGPPESKIVGSNIKGENTSSTSTVVSKQSKPLSLVKIIEEKGIELLEDEKHEVQYGDQQLSPSIPPDHDLISSNPLLNEEETEESPELMSRSAVLGSEFVTQAEVKSLQTRNRAHIKKINKLSELLDEEKKVSSQLSQNVMTMTEENVRLLDTIKLLRHENDQMKRESHKKLQRMKIMLEEKDTLVAKLRSSNESLRVQLAQRKDEQVLPQIKNVKPRHYDREKHRHSHRPSDAAKYEGERICDIGIDRSKKPTSEEHSHHQHREPRERERRRYHRHSDHRYHSDKTPTKQFSPEKFEPNPHVEETSSDSQNECPVCKRLMPSKLTEREMTLHIESCLKRQA